MNVSAVVATTVTVESRREIVGFEFDIVPKPSKLFQQRLDALDV